MISRDNLERILELRKIISEEKKVEFGDKHVTELNSLIDSIPDILSREEFIKHFEQYLDDIIDYRTTLESTKQKLDGSLRNLHNLCKDYERIQDEFNKYKTLSQQDKEAILLKRDKIIVSALKTLKDSCSEEAYSKIESSINAIYNSNK